MASTFRAQDDAWKAPMDEAMQAMVTIQTAVTFSFGNDPEWCSQARHQELSRGQSVPSTFEDDSTSSNLQISLVPVKPSQASATVMGNTTSHLATTPAPASPPIRHQQHQQLLVTPPTSLPKTSQIPFKQNPNPCRAPGKRRQPKKKLPISRPAKRPRWSEAEDKKVVRLRRSGKEWNDVSLEMPGRSAMSCAMRYKNHLKHDLKFQPYVEKQIRLARLYARYGFELSFGPISLALIEISLRRSSTDDTLRYRADLWQPIATVLGISWSECEAMHWELGEVEIARLAVAEPQSDRTRESTQVSEGRDFTPFRFPSVDGCPHEPGTPGRLALTPIDSEQSFSMFEEDEEEEERIKIDLKSAVARSRGIKRPVTSDHSKGQRTPSNMARSASRSSNYSPPSPSVPEAPKALRCDTTKSEATSKYVRKLSTDLSTSHCSSSRSPIAAPWNNHQTEVTVLGDDDCSAKRARIAPSTDSPLPEFIDSNHLQNTILLHQGTNTLRTGHCDFEATRRGCTLKHKLPPDEATQRQIGINISAPWLRNDSVVQELEHERQSRRLSGPFDNPFERTGEREHRREPAYIHRERMAGPSLGERQG
ncbi:hypothetical protein OEA41_008685 [Lepraria neglecta]|uniref:Myb-like domain-containing protein n=1 Tax=Lepraria neglecta TaxID=209136 RepID=A0AAE0DG18_9LECA|nr:hypothetical protein OEA41_008685 [Lepraria neglecta]